MLLWWELILTGNHFSLKSSSGKCILEGNYSLELKIEENKIQENIKHKNTQENNRREFKYQENIYTGKYLIFRKIISYTEYFPGLKLFPCIIFLIYNSPVSFFLVIFSYELFPRVIFLYFTFAFFFIPYTTLYYVLPLIINTSIILYILNL